MYREASGKLEEVYFIEFDIKGSEITDLCSTDSLVKKHFTDGKLMLTNVSMQNNFSTVDDIFRCHQH